MKKIIILIITTILSLTCFAGGKVIGNGGDEIAFDFYQIGISAIAEVQSDLEKYPELRDVNLLEIIKSTEILVSEYPIYSLKEGVRQASTAINYTDPSNTVVVYGPRWSRTNNMQIKKALALHEVLSLAGIENTGNYNISKRYLQSFGLNCTEGLCENLPRYSCNFTKDDKVNPIITLDTVIIGSKGEDMENVDFHREDMKATILMDSNINKGHFILALYQNNKIVGRTVIRGTSFSPFVMLEWENFETKISWILDCSQY